MQHWEILSGDKEKTIRKEKGKFFFCACGNGAMDRLTVMFQFWLTLRFLFVVWCCVDRRFDLDLWNTLSLFSDLEHSTVREARRASVGKESERRSRTKEEESHSRIWIHNRVMAVNHPTSKCIGGSKESKSLSESDHCRQQSEPTQ